MDACVHGTPILLHYSTASPAVASEPSSHTCREATSGAAGAAGGAGGWSRGHTCRFGMALQVPCMG
eukprot:scaffold84082_cov18-Tisochrysis_lutea.AAC.1